MPAYPNAIFAFQPLSQSQSRDCQTIANQINRTKNTQLLFNIPTKKFKDFKRKNSVIPLLSDVYIIDGFLSEREIEKPSDANTATEKHLESNSMKR